MNTASQFVVTPKDFLYFLPVSILVVFGLIAILAEAFTKGTRRDYLMGLTVLGSASAAVAAVYLWRMVGTQEVALFRGMLVADRLGMFLVVLFSGATALTALLSGAHQREHDWQMGEFYGLMLLSTAGMGIIAMSGDLVSLFIGIETMSLAVYVMCASNRSSRESAEGAMKYFLMGAFASGFLLYGMALLYGAAGSTNLDAIQKVLAQDPTQPLVLVSVILLVAAFGFKIAAVPFHMWTPDAYQGAPVPVTGYMAAAVKAAAFAGVIRLFAGALGGDVIPFGRMGWTHMFGVLAAITMTVGNIAALRQENIKRMLAYSSISHAGVILVAVVAAGVDSSAQVAAMPALLYYLVAYSLTTLGAFGVLAWIGRRGQDRNKVDDWNGLAGSYPGVALAMTIFMLSLGGIPPTAGFFGKFLIFKAALTAYDQQLLWLVVVGVVNSAISIFYYLRVVMAMYFRDPSGEFVPISSSAIKFVIIVTAFLVLQMGLMPSRWLGYAGM